MQDFIQWCLKNGHSHVVAKDIARRERKKRKQQWRWNLPKKSFKTSGLFVNDKRDYYRNTYLKSDHWKALRAKKLKANKSCEQCGSKGLLDVHHLRYRNLYDVTLQDLKTLCRRCHALEHEKEAKTAQPLWMRRVAE